MRATPHASNASCSSKLLLNINTITRRGRVRPSTRVRASRRARPRAWCLHPLQACAAYPYARVYAMRRDFVWILSKGKGTPTPAHAGSAHAPRPHAHGAPSPHDRASPGWRVPTLWRKREAHSTLRSSSRTFSHRHDKSPRRRLRRRRQLEDYTPCAPSSCDLGDV